MSQGCLRAMVAGKTAALVALAVVPTCFFLLHQSALE
jgi:hypothetical protein